MAGKDKFSGLSIGSAMRSLPFLLLCVTFLASCSSLLHGGTKWPKLVPLSELRAKSDAVTDTSQLTAASDTLDARAAALRKRAAALRSHQVDTTTDARLKAAIPKNGN